MEFRRKQYTYMYNLVLQPDIQLRHQQVLSQAIHVYLQLLRIFPDYPPAVELRLALADAIDTSLPGRATGEYVLGLLA